MGAFDFLAVMVAIVLGLGITHLLRAVARICGDRMTVARWYAPSLLWSAGLFLVMLQHWWSDYGHRNTHQWTFTAYFWSIMIPAELYVASYLIMPIVEANERVDLAREYQRVRIPFFLLLLVLLATTFAQEFAFSGRVDMGADLAFKVLFGGLALIGVLRAHNTVQQVVAWASFGLLVAYVALLFRQLPT